MYESNRVCERVVQLGVRCCIGWLVWACVLFSLPVSAYHLPEWEFGLGAGVLRIPAYRGAAGHNNVWLPVPYVAYRGPRFRVDEDGMRGALLHSERFQLDFSVAGSLPVTGGDGVREGMPGLDPIAEVGPLLNVVLGKMGDRHQGWEQQWWLRVPLRAALSVGDPLIAHQGWVFSPSLDWQWVKGAGRARWRWSLSAGPIFASEGYHDYFYSVGSRNITSVRSKYEAVAGYGGNRIGLTLAVNSKKWFVGGFVRYDDLHGAAFEDSPLVEARSYLAAGVAVSRIFVQSDKRVGHY